MISVVEGSQSRKLEERKRGAVETRRIKPSTTISLGQNRSVISNRIWEFGSSIGMGF
jgi:hypothetical protein